MSITWLSLECLTQKSMYIFTLYRMSVIILTPLPLHTHIHSIVRLCRKAKRKVFFRDLFSGFSWKRREMKNCGLCRKRVPDFSRLKVERPVSSWFEVSFRTAVGHTGSCLMLQNGDFVSIDLVEGKILVQIYLGGMSMARVETQMAYNTNQWTMINLERKKLQGELRGLHVEFACGRACGARVSVDCGGVGGWHAVCRCTVLFFFSAHKK